MSKELRKYVESALSKGANKEQIVETLVNSGWAKNIIKKVTDDYSGVDGFGIPIPAPKMQAHHLARDIFVYFIIFVTLCLSSCAIGAIFFNIIDFFSENLTDHKYSFTSVSWSIAQLIIGFPIFIALSSWVNGDLKRFPEKRESFVRKLMIYLILATTAIVSIADLIIILANFLKGEITTTFIFESIVILGISSLIFTYYFCEVKEDDNLIKSSKKE